MILIGIYEFHTLGYDEGTVIVPIEFAKISINELSQGMDKCVIGQSLCKPADDVFLCLFHVALKLKCDILFHPQV